MELMRVAMTENEAIEALKLEGGIEITGRPIRLAQFFEGIDSAIKALEEVQQYRQIGTVEECRAAVEKQTAAKPLGGMDADGNDYAICRECSAILSDGEWFAQYCPDCGKKVDWRDEE